MIFDEAAASRILAGRKTMDRRPARDGETECRYLKGKIYSVQKGKGRPGCGYVRVLGSRVEQLGAIDTAGARAEGYASRGFFLSAWRERYNLDAIDEDLLVWVIGLELVPVLPADQESPRLLGRAGGYTSLGRLALPGVGEAPPSGWQDARSGTASAGGSAPVSRGRPLPISAMEQLEASLQGQIRAFRGEDPEDVAVLCPGQGTPGEIRQRRRRMGLRAVDGLESLCEEQAAVVRARLLAEGCSVRELAHAMDWSVGKAQKVISDYRALGVRVAA